MASKTRPRSQRSRRSPWIRGIKLAFVSALILFTGVFCVVFLLFLQAVNDAKLKMPNLKDKFEAVAKPPSRILTADGVELYRVSEENRIPLKLSEIPLHVRQAFLAAEDKRFYEHNGVDNQGLLRAFVQLFEKGHASGGGSTITMQLAKRLYNGSEKSFQRKMQDIAFAYEIERTVANKDRILELYMNQVYFGEGAHGIGSAAKIYLGKTVDKLTISEAALLARCVRMPNRQNPIRDFKVAMENRDVVLEIMRDEKMITPDEYDKAIEEQPKVNKTPPRGSAFYSAGYGQHFVRHVLQTLDQDNLGIDLKSGGYTIYTTIDSHLQRLAEKTVRRVVREHASWKINEGAFVAIDRDGRILCEVGGTDFSRTQYNIISQGRLQPGSGFKPFVYATALKEGAITLDSRLSNAPIHIKVDRHTSWDPQNSSPRENENSYSVARALALSVNRPAISTILKVGPDTVVQYARDYFGFKSKLLAVPSLALGTSQVSPLELAEGYSVFMLHGDRVHPYPISRIVGDDGSILREYTPQKSFGVFDPAVSDQVDQLLLGVVQHGTGSAALPVPNARGKTGTTNSAKDAWFTGYTDGVLGVCWVGNERLVHGQWKQLAMASQVFGGTTAVYIWRDVMQEVHQRYGLPPVVDAPPVSEASVKKKPNPDQENGTDGGTVGDLSTAGNPSSVDGQPADGSIPDGQPIDPAIPTVPSGTDSTPSGKSTAGNVDRRPGKKPPATPLPVDTIGNDKSPSTEGGDIDNPAPKPKSERKDRHPISEQITVDVCADSGDLATPYCPETVSRTFPRGQQPKHSCKLHRPGG